jgi:hypothetical protein
LFRGDDKDQTWRVKILACGGTIFSIAIKKAPVPQAAQGLLTEHSKQSTAGTTAGARAATASPTERIGGGDGKSGPIAGINEINFNGSATFLQISIDKKFQAVFLVHLIAIF